MREPVVARGQVHCEPTFFQKARGVPQSFRNVKDVLESASVKDHVVPSMALRGGRMVQVVGPGRMLVIAEVHTFDILKTHGPKNGLVIERLVGRGQLGGGTHAKAPEDLGGFFSGQVNILAAQLQDRATQGRKGGFQVDQK